VLLGGVIAGQNNCFSVCGFHKYGKRFCVEQRRLWSRKGKPAVRSSRSTWSILPALDFSGIMMIIEKRRIILAISQV
jgi:hypothetical protein